MGESGWEHNSVKPIYFLLMLQKLFVLLGPLPGNAGQIMESLIEDCGTALPQRNDRFTKVCRKIGW